MMHHVLRIILFALCFPAWAADLSIPNLSVSGWAPSTATGVRGGIEQYFDQSGDADERNTSTAINVVTAHSADNTGVATSHTEVQAAITAVGSGGVVYLPAGLYKFSNAVGNGGAAMKSNFTIRGAGSSKFSSSSHTVGTGTKVFTVPAGQAWTAAAGIRISRWTDPQIYMDGTVTSYSGTTLTVDITSVVGSGTYTDWKVHITCVYQTGSGGCFEIGYTGSDYIYFTASGAWLSNTTMPTTVGDYDAGDTVITLTDASTMSIGNLIQIRPGDQRDDTLIAAGAIPVINLKGYEYNRAHNAIITDKTGDVITISPPLYYAHPESLTPKVYLVSNYTSKVGVEHMTLWGHATLYSPMVFYQSVDSWLYDVDSEITYNYNVSTAGLLWCTIKKCWGFNRSIGGSNGAALLFSINTACLVEDNIFGWNFPTIEVNGGAVGNAVLYNYLHNESGSGLGAQLNTNHTAHNSYNLYEGNIFVELKCDGYFGGASEDTVFRNWGKADSDLAYIALRRFTRAYNIVGNVIGEHGVANSSIGYGLPNIGNDASSGEATPSSGDFWLHWKAQATLTTRTSDTSGVITFTTLTGANYQDPDLASSLGYLCFYWSGGAHTDFGIVSVDGSTLTFDAGVGGGDVLPSVSTVLTVWPGSSGFQEIDNDVANTTFQEGNYLVTALVGAQEDLAGATLPSSLAYTSQPTWWPSSLTWPPVNPASPTYGVGILPAGYRYLNGVDASDSVTGTPRYKRKGVGGPRRR